MSGSSGGQHHSRSDRLPVQVFWDGKELPVQNLPEEADVHFRARAIFWFSFNELTKYPAARGIIGHSVLW